MRATQRDERIDSAYWQYVHVAHVAPSDELEAAYYAAWRAGGKQVLRDSAEVAGVVPLFRTFCDLLEADE